jgi:hypothetical protein
MTGRNVQSMDWSTPSTTMQKKAERTKQEIKARTQKSENKKFLQDQTESDAKLSHGQKRRGSPPDCGYRDGGGGGVLWRDLVLLSKCVASPNTVGKRIVDPLQFNWRQSLSLRDWGVNVSEECWMGELMMAEPQRWCTYGSDTVLINLNAQVRLYVRCMQCTYREDLEFPRYYHREFDIFPSFGRVLGPYFLTTRHSQKSWDLGRHSAPYFQPWWEEKEKDRDKERKWESEITRSLKRR